MIIKTPNKNTYLITSLDLSYGHEIDFMTLSELKEEVDFLFQEEQSRLLQESFSGDLDDCVGCKI